MTWFLRITMLRRRHRRHTRGEANDGSAPRGRAPRQPAARTRQRGSAAGIAGQNIGGLYQRRLSPWTTSNLSITKRFTPDLSVGLTINNLTNNQYRQDFSETGYPFFDPYIGADLAGRRFTLSANYKF